MIATVKGYVVAYPTVADRLNVAASLQSFSILLGQPHHAETVAGFLSWRITVVIALIGAIWGLLTSTGLLRGEEDAGRWELLLSGQTTKRRAAVQALLGLGGALALMFCVTALFALGASQLPGAHFGPGAALYFALALVSGAAMFLAIGSVTSQLSATRSQAATITAGVLGVSFLVRMVADSSKGLEWLLWCSPIGWIELLRSLRDIQPLAFVPIVALIGACGGATVVMAARRDLNGSILRERAPGDGAARWLVGPTTLAIRLGLPTAIGWLIGIATMALIQGLIARSAATLLASSPAFVTALGRLGIKKASEGYLGVSFLIIALLICVLAASQVSAIRDEEGSGRLDTLLVRPVARLWWLAGRVGTSLAVLVLAALGAGAFTWIGAASQHAGVDLVTLLEAGANALVPGIFVLGAGVLVLGIRPRLVSPVAYGIVAWSFLIDLVGSLLRGIDRIRDLSLFTHMALAPAAKPDWGTAAVIVGLAAAGVVMGAYVFRLRDMEYA